MRYLNDEWTEVQLIVRSDGLLIDDIAKNILISNGAYQDVKLGGFVISKGGMPWFYSVFLPAHELIVLPISVPYNPEWYSPPSPPVAFDNIPTVFHGFPHSENMMISYFITPECMNPFLATWQEREKVWKAQDKIYTPENAVNDCWIFIATIGESIQMSYTRIDEANQRQARHAELQAIIDDVANESAYRVGIETGRIYSDHTHFKKI